MAEKKPLTSKDLAAALHRLADHIEKLPSTLIDEPFQLNHWAWSLESAKNALAMMPKPVKKSYSTAYLTLRSKFDPCLQIDITVPRDKVCRKTQDEKWECEPMFAPDDLNELTK